MADRHDNAVAAEPLLPAEAYIEDPKPAKGAWKTELRTLLLLALPCIITTCSSQTMVVVGGRGGG